MGQYLSHPVTEKEEASGESDAMAYGVSAMQVRSHHPDGTDPFQYTAV